MSYMGVECIIYTYKASYKHSRLQTDKWSRMQVANTKSKKKKTKMYVYFHEDISNYPFYDVLAAYIFIKFHFWKGH